MLRACSPPEQMNLHRFIMSVGWKQSMKRLVFFFSVKELQWWFCGIFVVTVTDKEKSVGHYVFKRNLSKRAGFKNRIYFVYELPHRSSYAWVYLYTARANTGASTDSLGSAVCFHCRRAAGGFTPKQSHPGLEWNKSMLLAPGSLQMHWALCCPRVLFDVLGAALQFPYCPSGNCSRCLDAMVTTSVKTDK